MFTSGVYLDFEGNDAPLTSNNPQSALLQPDVVQTKLLHELSNDRIAGPFHTPPFINVKSSPLALREKQQRGTYRLLHNLPYPCDLNSVNYNIPKSASTVTYENLSHAVTAIQDSLPNAHMAKSDIADAFRLIPLHPSQYRLTGGTNIIMISACHKEVHHLVESSKLSPQPLNGFCRINLGCTEWPRYYMIFFFSQYKTAMPICIK